MPFGIQRLAAERTGRATRGHDLEGACSEGEGRARLQVDAYQIGILVRIFGDDLSRLLVLVLFLVFVGDLTRLNDDTLIVDVPHDGHRPNPERLDEGLLEGSAVDLFGRRRVRNVRPAATNLRQELGQPFRQDCDLDLLERDADYASSFPSLQVEHAAARLTNRPRDEAIRVLERIHPTRH